MCRMVGYIGRPLALSRLLFETDHSLITQVYDARLYALLNLGGLGFAAWDETVEPVDEPFIYKTAEVPVFDRNARPLARKMHPNTALAHIRGVFYEEREVINEQNVHPFLYSEVTKLALVMNGSLARFAEMRFDLLDFIKPEVGRHIEGTTDSEWLYAVLLSQLGDLSAPLDADRVTEAVNETIAITRSVRERHGINTTSEMNIMLSDGHFLVSVHYVFDYGWFPELDPYYSQRRRYEFGSLWYTMGGDYSETPEGWMMTQAQPIRSALFASEPLTEDVSTWLQVPEYSVITAVPDEAGSIVIRTHDLAA